MAFLEAERDPAVAGVVGDPVGEPERVLARHFEAPALRGGQRGGIGHVRVQDAPRLGPGLVNGHVDAERRGFDLALAFDDAAFRVDDDQIPGPDLGPVQPVGMGEVELLPARQAQGEMIVDAFVEVVFRGPAQCRRKIDALLRVAQAHPVLLLWPSAIYTASRPIDEPLADP